MDRQKKHLFGKKNRAFTIVEMVVVITILSILGIISLLSFQGFMTQSQNAKKITTLQSLKQGLELIFLQTHEYPPPESPYAFGEFGGEQLMSVGFIGKNISQRMNFSKTPFDELSQSYFTYGRSVDKKYFQVGTIIDMTYALHNVGSTVYAQTPYVARVEGNYNGLFKYKKKLYNIPSFLLTHSGTVSLDDPNLGFVVNNAKNLPYNPREEFQNASQLPPEIFALIGSEALGVGVVDFPSSKSDFLTKSGTYTALGYSSKVLENAFFGDGQLAYQMTARAYVPPEVVYENCELDGAPILHGLGVTRYQSASVAYGNTCISESRTCTNGVLSGTYTFSSCSVSGAIGTFTLSNNSVTQGGNVTISNTCSVAPTSYTSSNTSVATISGNTITAVGSGTTNITPVGGACGDANAKILTVTPPTGTFSLSSSSVAQGTTVTISNTCSVAPTSYTSSNTSVATISGNTITTIGSGTTNITPIGGACGNSTAKILTVTQPQTGVYASCSSSGQIVTATTIYPGVATTGVRAAHGACDAADIIVCTGSQTGVTLSACNLGATKSSEYASCTSATNCTLERTGYYFQWGRNKPFHPSTSNSSTYFTGHIAAAFGTNASTDPYDFISFSTIGSVWSNTDNSNNWGGLNGNNLARQGPCADGYHVPTSTEWTKVKNAISGTYSTVLKIPLTGYWKRDTGIVSYTTREIWASDPHPTNTYTGSVSTYTYSNNVVGGNNRGNGFPVRCFKNE